MTRPRHTDAALALALSIALSASSAGPASATASADLQELGFQSVSYSHEAQTTSARVDLVTSNTAEALSADDTGWDISVHATSMNQGGHRSGSGVGELSLVSIEAPIPSEGLSEATDPVTGPKLPDSPATGSLATPRVVLQADPGHARGSYTQELVFSLRLPPGARSGTYTGTVTATVSPRLSTTPTPPRTQATPGPRTESSPVPAPEPTQSPDQTPGPEPTPYPSHDPAPPVESTTAPAPTAAPPGEPSVTTEPEAAPAAEPEPIITPTPEP